MLQPRTRRPFSSLGVPVTTGMSDWYENRRKAAQSVIPAPEPDSCSAGTVPHPVPRPLPQTMLQPRTRHPISSLGVPVTTSMANCYENEPHTPTPSFPRRACPVLDTGREPIPGRCHRSRGNGESRAYFHPLMWPSQGHSDSERSASEVRNLRASSGDGPVCRGL